MSTTRGILTCAVAFAVAALGAGAAGQQTNGNDALGKAAIKVTGMGKAPDSKRGTPRGG